MDSFAQYGGASTPETSFKNINYNNQNDPLLRQVYGGEVHEDETDEQLEVEEEEGPVEYDENG